MQKLIREDPTKDYPPACDTLGNLQYSYDETDLDYGGPNMFESSVNMPNTYKEITQVRALDLHSLVGNCGGYIGLFLGEFL